MKKRKLLAQLFILISSLSLIACTNTLTNGVVQTNTTLLVSASQSTPTLATSLVTETLVPTPTPTPTPTSSPLPTPSPTPIPTPTPTPGVTEKKVGFIDRIYQIDDLYYIDIDYVQFLTGDAAVKKAIADKSNSLIDNGDGTFGVDNDYYIANDSNKIRTFPLAANCELKIVNWESEDLGLLDVTMEKFVAAYEKQGNWLLVDINVENGMAISLVEIYTP